MLNINHIKYCCLSDKNYQIMSELISTGNEDLLANFETVDFNYNDLSAKGNSGLLIKEYGELIYKAFKVIYGDINAMFIANSVNEKFDYLTTDEYNFMAIFNLSNRINLNYTLPDHRKKVFDEVFDPFAWFDRFLDTSDEFLLKYYHVDMPYSKKIYYYLALINKNVKTDYKIIEDFEEYLKELINDQTILEQIEKFDPITEIFDTDMSRFYTKFLIDDYKLLDTWILLAMYGMNKSVFLDKICVICLTSITKKFYNKFGLELYLNAKYQNLNLDEIYEFMIKYRANLVTMSSVIGGELIDVIKQKNIVTSDDLFNAVKLMKPITDNKNFLLGNTDLVEFEELFANDVENKEYINSYLEQVFIWYSNINEEFTTRLELISNTMSYLIKPSYKGLDIENDNNFEKFEKYNLGLNFSHMLLNACEYNGYQNKNNFSLTLFNKNESLVKNINGLSRLLYKNEEFIPYAVKNYKKFPICGRFVVVKMLAIDLGKYSNEFLKLTESNTNINDLINSVYKSEPVLIEKLISMLKSKKAPERKKAFKQLSSLSKTDYINEIQLAFDVEDNEKLKSEMETFLLKLKVKTDIIVDEKSVDSNKDDVLKLLLKQEKLIKLLPVENFTKIKDKSGKYVELSLVKASLIAYAEDNSTFKCPVADEIMADFDEVSLALFVKDVFNIFLESSMDTKYRWLIFYCSKYGDEDMVDLIVKGINLLVQRFRGALAGDMVNALTLNKSRKALVVVEEFSRKFKHKQVKKVAISALERMSRELNLTKEEFADRLIPDFGFDEDMKLEFDYGTRKFKVYLNTNLDLSIEDEKGKVMKNLPKIGANDTTEIAQASIDRFKEMKKSIKVAVKSQSERLELALSNGRTWTYENFEKLFVKNPIMYNFATSLIWGIYENGKLTETFRYSDDGTFSTVEDDEFTLKDNMIIGLVHPIELDDKLLSIWKELLNDYEIKQSILQLDREVFKLNYEDVEGKFIKLDSKIEYSKSSLKTNLTKAGFETGVVLDAGYFHWFEHNNLCGNIKAKVEFSGMSIVYYDGEETECTLDKISFKDDKGSMEIKNVPVKIISEIYSVISKITVIE